MDTIAPLLISLKRDAPKEYAELESELHSFNQAVDNCWAVNGELHTVLVLARFITTSTVPEYRLLLRMAACKEREANGRRLLQALEYLGKPHFTASGEKHTLLVQASHLLTRWVMTTGAHVSFGTEMDREICRAAEKVRRTRKLPAI